MLMHRSSELTAAITAVKDAGQGLWGNQAHLETILTAAESAGNPEEKLRALYAIKDLITQADVMGTPAKKVYPAGAAIWNKYNVDGVDKAIAAAGGSVGQGASEAATIAPKKTWGSKISTWWSNFRHGGQGA